MITLIKREPGVEWLYLTTNKYHYHYTKKFLEYGVFKDKIWQTILTSNQWVKPPGEEKHRMIVDENVFFNFNLGNLILRCEDSHFSTSAGVRESPYVVNTPDP